MERTWTRAVLIACLTAIVTAVGMIPPTAEGAEKGDPCAVPDALAKAGEKERARKDYVRVLRADPTKGCAADGLAKLNAPAADTSVQTLCTQAATLASSGLDSEAFAVYKEALKKDPQKPCAKQGVAATKPDGKAWPSEAADWLTGAIPTLLILLGGAAIALLALMLAGYERHVHAALLTLPLVGRLLSPRLTIEDPDDGALGDKKVGASIAARIKERLSAFSDESRGDDGRGGRRRHTYELDFGMGDEVFVNLLSKDAGLRRALEKASDVSDHTKVVMALVDLIYAALPIKRLKVAGVLNPPVPHEASATLILESNEAQQAAVTLARATVADPSAADYVGLAEPAAVWIQYEVARAVRDAEISPSDAMSYAFVREGLDRYFAGDAPAADAAYSMALALNPENWAARVNRAVLRARLYGDYIGAGDLVTDGLTELRKAEA